MSFVQRFFTFILPHRWSKQMEAESLRWFIRCGKCGYERSVWEAGGIRWGGAGYKVSLFRCRSCGRLSWHRFLYK